MLNIDPSPLQSYHPLSMYYVENESDILLIMKQTYRLDRRGANVNIRAKQSSALEVHTGYNG